MEAYVIRKPNDEMSENYANQCIESAKQFNINVEKFDGVYNDHDSVFQKYNIKPYHKLGDGRSKVRGIQGCFLSHYLLWIKCIELNEPIIVLEHDALFIRPIPDNILDFFEYHCVLDDAVHEKNYQEILDKDGPLEIKHHPYIKGKIVFSRIEHVRGSHAHIVKPKGAKKLIESVKEHGWMPADRCVNTNYTDYITVRPIPVRCHPFFSDMENRMKYSHVISDKVRI